MSGLVDSSPPGGSIIPYKNFTPPPETPDKLAVSVTPGSRDQYAIDSDKRPMPPPGPYLDTNGQLVQPTPEQVAALPTPAGQPTDLTKPDVAKPEDAHAKALDYVTRTRQLEGSGKDPNSSAVGGFINSTWLDTIHKIRPETLNMPPEQVLAMRYDESPAGIALRDQATAQYASENSGVLQKAGLPVNPTNLRLAHFLGPGGAVQVLSVPPGTLMSEINPKAVAANPTLQGRTAGEVIQLANDQMNGDTAANMRRTALGPFNAGASAVLDRLMGDIDRQGKNYESAIAEGKDLRSVARAAMAKWELSSEHPPQDMRENWNQWAGAAIGLAMLGGFFGKNHTAAINAAGEMLQAANAADVRTYDIAYKRWKDHNDNGLKLIELLHGEARDVINDAKNSYDMTVTKLATLGTMYGLVQKLDPASVENMQKNLQTIQLTTSIQEAQKKAADEEKIRKDKAAAVAAQEADELTKHPEWKGVVPPQRHLEIQGEAERTGKGTGITGTLMSDDDARFAARQYLKGDRTVMSGFGYGNTGAANRAKVRTAIRTEAEAQGMQPEDVAIAIAEFEGTKAGERTLGQVGARADRAVNEANNMSELVVQKSDAFPRTDFIPVNRVLEATRRGTGDTRIVEFAAALNSFINAYARAISPTGQSTVSDKDHAREVLETAQTPDQVRAVIGVLRQEMQFALQSTGQAKQQLRGGEPSAPSAPLPTDLPAAARSQLEEGTNTTFENGQVWTLKNGQPVQVK